MQAMFTRKHYYLLALFVAALFWLNPVVSLADDVADTQATLTQLQTQIEAKQKSYDNLQSQITSYKNNLAADQQQHLTLQSEIQSLDTQKALTESEIQQTEVDLQKLGLQINQTQLSINSTQTQIGADQDKIGQLINKLYTDNQTSYLDIALTHATLSDFSSLVEYTENINTQFKNALADLQTQNDHLQAQKRNLVSKKTETQTKQTQLAVEQQGLQGQINYKDNLLSSVQNDESKFQQLVSSIQKDQDSVNTQIANLQQSNSQAEQKLKQLQQGTTNSNSDTNTATTNTDNSNTNVDTNIPTTIPSSFKPGWPLHGPITATFHDPTYVFKNIFQHNAIDIAAQQGTPIRAADTGVVAITRAPTSPSLYAYIMILHAENYGTLYGHVSAIYVQPNQVVQKGQIIGLSGATPGTNGAGPYTTGPHLHFEILKNGIPVDPQLFLPPQ